MLYINLNFEPKEIIKKFYFGTICFDLGQISNLPRAKFHSHSPPLGWITINFYELLLFYKQWNKFINNYFCILSTFKKINFENCKIIFITIHINYKLIMYFIITK